MKIIILTLLFGLLGYTISKPLDDASDALVEIEKQRLIKFPEEAEQPSVVEGDEKHDEAKRILQEIEKINQALGYVKKQDPTRSPAILDSSQYLFPNTGYQPFHVQNPQVKGVNGETLLLPSIRSVKLETVHHNKASEHNRPPTRKPQKPKTTTKPKNPLYFKPQRVEIPAPQTKAEEKLLPSHFVIPVRLFKQNKQQYVAKNNPQEYKIKGYKIVGDIDHFYGKTKSNKTSTNSKVKSTAKYHLFFLPQEVVPKSTLKDIKASDNNSKENTSNTSREEKVNHRPYKVQANSQTVTTGNTVNTTSSSQIVRKRLVAKPQKVSASSSTVVKVQPTTSGSGQQQQQVQQQVQQQQQQQQQHYEKPTAAQQITQIIQPPEATPSYSTLNNPTAPTNSNNNNNNNPNQIIKNRPLFNLQNNNNNGIKNRPLLELQNNINNINNATSNAIKNAFQNIFRLPFRPQDPNKPLTATEFTTVQTVPLQIPQLLPAPQQQFYTSPSSPQAPPHPFYGNDDVQNDHLESDYKWDDENVSADSSSSDDQYTYNTSHESGEPEEKKIFAHLLKHKQETQNDALKHGGIIIQRLKVRKGGIAIAGPGGVATAGSGGTAIVGPGGYALTHPRSLTIAGPGAKIIAIPSNVDLKDALQRTNLDTQMFPREGRIVATGPTVYYAPPTGDYVEI
ncbi:myb-like protein AA [Lucilia sericata]|uniref:myb-like protein AA n=1 Tax=Lucilia sericata TaxID=13632 RepID=UPI0018A8153A|nr:myb-like protein AA [Lucilia sericata]